MKTANSLTIEISKSTKNGFTLNFESNLDNINRARWAIVLWLCHWCITYSVFKFYSLILTLTTIVIALQYRSLVLTQAKWRRKRKQKMGKFEINLPVPIPFFHSMLFIINISLINELFYNISV
jgi:hypothetical protein